MEPYRQYEKESVSLPIRSIKATRKGVEDLRRYMDEKGRLSVSCSSTFPERSAARGGSYRCRDGYIFVPLKADNIVMQSSLQPYCKVLEEELDAK